MNGRTGARRLPAFIALALAACALAGACSRGSRAPGTSTPLIADGMLGVFGDTSGDAVSLTGISHARVGESERLELTFADSAALPARRVGPCRVELLRDLGLVRVWLPHEVRETAVTDRFFGNTLTDRAYVVHGTGDSMFVDILLGVAARARATERVKPAALVIDLEPGGTPFRAGPAISQRCVVLEPRPGPARYPLDITGYARTFEANVIARLMNGETVVRDTFTTSTDWSATWGVFRMTIADGPRDSLALFVGELSAESGEPQGVTVDVDLRETEAPH